MVKRSRERFEADRKRTRADFESGAEESAQGFSTLTGQTYDAETLALGLSPLAAGQSAEMIAGSSPQHLLGSVIEGTGGTTSETPLESEGSLLGLSGDDVPTGLLISGVDVPHVIPAAPILSAHELHPLVISEAPAHVPHGQQVYAAPTAMPNDENAAYIPYHHLLQPFVGNINVVAPAGVAFCSARSLAYDCM